MFYLLISLQLIFIVVNGYTISKEANNTVSDIYEIKEDKASNTITFVNPKTDHQTLREIVYYHLIEKPYGENEKPESLSEDPELDETERPLTNSHGFPFLESFEKEPSVESDDNNDDQPLEEFEENEEAEIQVSPDSPIEEEEIIYYDEELVDVDVSTHTTTTMRLRQDETTAIEIVSMTSEPQTTTPVVESTVETKAKHTRKLLFDRVKERYYSKTNDTEDTTSPSILERRKRDISMVRDIPEAPKLGPIDFDSLPPYLRTLISTKKPTELEKPQMRSILPGSDDDDESERLEEIRHKMKNMMSNLKNPRREEKPKPRTYGMNLTEDHGYVWNDIWSKSGVRYNVDGLNSIEEDSKNDGKFNKNTDHDSGIDEAIQETTELNISGDEYEEKPEENIKLDHSDEEGDDEKSEDFYHHDHKDEKKDDEKKLDRSHDKLIQPEERGDEEPVDFDHHDEKKGDGKEVKSDKDDDSEGQARKRKNDKNKDTIDELLENEQFWNWLADWTSVYMDVLADHINDMVKEEVTNQIKQYEESQKNDNKETFKHEDDIKLDKKDPMEHKDNDSNMETENNEKIPENKKKGEQNPDMNDEELLKKRKDRDDKKKPDNSKIEEKPSKIEKEPTNNKSKDEDPKIEEKPSLIEKEPPKNKTIEENIIATPMVDDKQKEYPTKIQAQNLYGNSVGSEKVTNIFIFYPNSDTNQIIKDIKNDSDSEINVFGNPDSQTPSIDTRINVPNVEKKTEPPHENDNKATTTETNKKDTEIDKKDPTTESSPKKENDVNNVPSTTSTESPKETTTSTNPDVPSTTKKIDEDLLIKDVVIEINEESIKDKDLEQERKDKENGSKNSSKDKKDNLEEEKDKKAETLTDSTKSNEKDKELNDESKDKENESKDSAKDKKDKLEENKDEKDKTSTESTKAEDKEESESTVTETSVRESSTSELPDISSTAASST